MPRPWSLHIKGPNYQRHQAIDAVTDAGLQVVARPPGELDEAPDDRILIVRTAREYDDSAEEFQRWVETALDGTHLKVAGGRLPGPI